MLKLLTQFESISVTLNVVDAKTNTYGITVMPKLKAPLVITFTLDEVDEVERQIADYLGDAEQIVSASNIASVKGTAAQERSKKEATAAAPSNNPKATTVTPAAPKTAKAGKTPKADKATEEKTEEKKNETGDFSDLLSDLGI